MKADPAAQAALLGVQRIDSRLAAIDRLLAESPVIAQLTDAQRRADEASEALRDANGLLEDIQAELGRLEADMRVVSERTARDREMLDATANSKQAQGLHAELDSLAKRRVYLENAQLDVMLREEAQAAAVNELTQTRQTITQELSELRTQSSAQALDLESERAELTADRVAATAGSDSALLTLYDRVRTRGFGIGAATLNGRVCGACAIELGPSDFAALAKLSASDVAQCPQCDAILVRQGGETR